MSQPISKEYLQSLACPSCSSAKLLLTKEKIIICQSCLNGYKMMGDVPDFRLENAISFKKKMGAKKSTGVNAVLTVALGNHKDQSLDIKMGHCVILGRQINQNFDDERTFVGKPQDFNPSFSNLDPSNQQLIVRYLSKGLKRSINNRESLLTSRKKLLGEYVREPDFLMVEPSVSRSHAVVYQNKEGLHLLDLISKNGTYVNGCEIESSRLKDNDVISLGTASMRVRFY